MTKRAVRKRSKHSGRKYKRYKKGYWKGYKRQRKWRYVRVLANIKRRLANRPDPYVVKDPGTVGRPPIPPKSVLVGILVKVLFDLSYANTESFLLWVCGTNGFLLGSVPAANTLQEHMKDIPLSYLEGMIKECVEVLEDCEVTLIMDATGLSTRQYGRWRTSRLSSKKVKRKFVKVHLSIDRNTNLILVGISTKGWKGDHPFGLKMVDKLRTTFKRYDVKLRAGLADAGYRSREMAKKIGEMGGRPIIKVKSNDTAKKKGVKEWSVLVKLQRDMPKEFLKVYCERVIIEGIISAMKSTFGTVVRSRIRHNQDVEVMCRMILWNYMHI